MRKLHRVIFVAAGLSWGLALALAAGAPIVGEWSSGTVTLSFHANGHYVWKDVRASLEGSYTLEGAKLALEHAGRVTVYRFTMTADQLQLNDGKGGAISFRRRQPAGPGENPLASVVGRWQARGAASVVLVLEPGGRYLLGRSQGVFKLGAGRIAFVDGTSGKTSTYEWKRFGEELRLRDASGSVLAFVRQ
ncbi:MAG: hypothetical protein KA419_16420 [Acidobacteria bacterium]|nr:hypothetical protein [Acidobacteriota bacterium]